ncbi:MAG: hypothetical protein JNL13_05495, partial [Chitinophagaceae bacterium]|nr:hypothetical protein [Chitinophagaceae bacterium]
NVEIDNDLFSSIKKETSAADADILRHDNIQAACHRFGKRIKSDIGLSMKINISCPGTIHRSEGGKLNRIVDLRK